MLKEKSIRHVEPLTLVLKGSSWYLFAYCLEKQEGRLFRLSRLLKLKVLTKSFCRREIEMPVSHYFSDKSVDTVELTLQFHQDISSSIGDLFGLDTVVYYSEIGEIIVRLPENEWLYSVLLSLGAAVTIVSPNRIADLIKKKAQDIVTLYSAP